MLEICFRTISVADPIVQQCSYGYGFLIYLFTTADHLSETLEIPTALGVPVEMLGQAALDTDVLLDEFADPPLKT